MTEFNDILRFHRELQKRQKATFDRSTSVGDLYTNRWKRAAFYGFGEGTSCYNNTLIIGAIRVGTNCWNGPNIILDGSGGFESRLSLTILEWLALVPAWPRDRI